MNDDHLASELKRAFGRYRMEPRPIEELAGSAGAMPAPDPLANRPPLLARRRMLGGLSLAGVAVAVVLAFTITFGLGPGGNKPQSAYAGWQPVPTKTNQEMRAEAQAECVRGWGESEDLPLVVQDQRGPVALFLFGRDGDYLSCILVPNGKGGYDADRVGVDARSVYKELLHEHFGWVASSGPRSDLPAEVTIFGMTDAAKIVVERRDGVQVQATVADGIFVAWWPGDAQVGTLSAYDATGIALASEEPFPSPCICKVQPASPNVGN